MQQTATTTEAPAKRLARPQDPVGFGLFLLAIVAAVGYFWSGGISLGDAWSTAEYSHGPLIPILSFVLFLKHLKEVPPQHPAFREQRVGIAVLAFALLLGAVGNVSRIPDIVTYALIIWVFALLLVLFGGRRGFQFWPSVVHLVFMLPLPAFLYWKLSITLQFFSAELGVEFIRMMNIPVYLDGNIIDLGAYKLDVAEACSGLRYLFPIMSFSYIFCMLYHGPIWHKAVLLLSAAPITIVMNSFRVGVIGVLVDAYGIEQAEGFLHFFEGWVIFLTCIAILFALAKLLQITAGDKRPIFQVLALDFDGLGPQLRRVYNIRRSKGLAILVGLTALAAVLTHFTPTPEPARIERDPLVLFPRTLGDWKASPAQRLEPNIEEVLGADDYYAAAFRRPGGGLTVDMFVAWYRSQTSGSGIHSPEVCMPAGGWEMSQIEKRTIDVPLAGGGSAATEVNRAVIRKGLARQLAYYWFEQRGRRMTSDYMAKAVTVWDAMTIGRTDGALVRLVTPISQTESDADAEARLKAFMGEMLPVLPQYVPE